MKTFIGRFIHSPSLDVIEYLEDHACIVSDEGQITYFGPKAGISINGPVTEIPPTAFMCPGFIDTHCHAPQFPNSGLGMDYALLEWLDKLTFPTECKFSDLEFAKEVYGRVVASSLSHGTTCSVYFASIHKEATLVLAKEAEFKGQRAFVGKVCMDCNCPDFYKETAEECLASNTDIINELKDSKLVRPIITPRFAPVCSAEMMGGLAELSEKNGLLIQSHISENKGECQWMGELYPSMSYAEVYDKYGLLTPRTIMAHAIYLTKEEIKLFKERQVSVSHCPLSNFALSSGVLRVRDLLDLHVKVGLGTDVSGGWSHSILEAMRYCVIGSRAIRLLSDPEYKPITAPEAFYLGTRGGAECIGRQDLGFFANGNTFDALLIDCHDPLKLFSMPGDSLEASFQRFFFNGDDRHIKQVYVNGKLVMDKLGQ